MNTTTDNEGIVYILTNPCFSADCVKIGMSSRLDVDLRLKELDTTGVPAPFDVYAKLVSPLYTAIERCMHNYFEEQRIRMNREFFNVTPEEALKQLEFYQHQFGGTIVHSHSSEQTVTVEVEDSWVPKNTKFTLCGVTGLSMAAFFNELVRKAVADGKIASWEALGMEFPSVLQARGGKYSCLFATEDEYAVMTDDRRGRFNGNPIKIGDTLVYTTTQWVRSSFKAVFDIALEMGYEASPEV